MTFPPESEPTNADLMRELRTLSSSVRDLNHLITGNGTPEKGHVVRLDRLEQAQRNATWWTRTTASAAIGAVVMGLWNLLHPGRGS